MKQNIILALVGTICLQGVALAAEPLSLTFSNPVNDSIVTLKDGQIESVTLTKNDLLPEILLPFPPIGENFTITFWVKFDEDPFLQDAGFTHDSPVTLLDLYPEGRSDAMQELVIRVMQGRFNATLLSEGQWRSLSGYSPEVTPGVWYFLAYTQSKEAGMLYVDGAVAGRTSPNPPVQNMLEKLTLGNFNKHRRFSGSIREFRIYDQTFNQEQVEELYRNPPEGVDSNKSSEPQAEVRAPSQQSSQPSSITSEVGSPIRPLAQEHVVFDESPDPPKIPLYTPSIIRLPSGRLVGASERGGQWKKLGNPFARIATSDDGGKTWTLRDTCYISHGRLFRAGGRLYYLGHNGDLQIKRSDDDGETWSEQVSLTDGQTWHQTAANVWYAKGNVYLVMERLTSDEGGFWSMLAPVLMRAKETDDLTKRESWTFASELVFADIVPGFRENNTATDLFGIPFFPQTHPKTNVLARNPTRQMHPMGWLEANVVQFQDPDHYWYDPTGRTFHLFMRCNTGGTGYAALAKVVENEDGTMTTSLETVPSGKTALFLPLPGGQMRFHILYDDKTKLYWMLGTQATDSMKRVETLPPDRFDLPNQERQRLVLYFSKNMIDWCFAGLVAVGPGNKGSRHYAAMDIDGEDLVILSRSGDERAQDAHNGNLITFHRVKNFRNLVY